MGTSNLSVTWDAQLAASAGEIPAGRVLTKDTAGRFVLATTANRAVWTGATMFAVSLTAGRGDQTVQACHAGFVPSSIVGTLSGTGTYVDCQTDGTMARSESTGVNTIAKYLPTGDIVVDLSLQDGSTSSGSAGFILVSDYGTTDTALGLADTAAQASTPPKRLLATQQITLANNITVASAIVFEGGSITAASTKTLTVAHTLYAPRLQIVYGSAALSFTGAQKEGICPEWTGATALTASGTGSVSSGSAVLTGTGFTAAMVGKTVVVWDQTVTSRVVRGTISGFTSSTSLTMSATAGWTGSAPYAIGSDSGAAIRAAITASRGTAHVSFGEGRSYMVTSATSIQPGTGVSPKLHGNNCAIYAAAAIRAIFDSDPGTDANANLFGANIERFNFFGCNSADYAIVTENVSFPARSCGVNGNWSFLTGTAFVKTAFKIVATQSSYFLRLATAYSGEEGFIVKGCNASVFVKCIATQTLGATKNGWTIDSTVHGGGEVYLNECGAEVVTGHGIEVLDTTGSGTVCHILNTHIEGCGLDGIKSSRPGVVVGPGVISGTAVTSSWPVHFAANGCVLLPGMEVGNYSAPGSLGARVATGATNCIVAPTYNETGDVLTDPVVDDTWPAKIHHRYAAGDMYMQGKLFIGSSTYTPNTTLDDALMLHGHARLRTGGLQMHTGGVLSPYGGIGKGTNYLLRSEEFDSASWTKSSCTVTANSVLGPISGTLADTLAFSSAAGFIRQEYAYGSSLADLNWTSGIWLRTSSGTATINIAQAVGSAATISSTTWTITTEWQFIRTTGSSSNTGTTFRLQIGPTSGTPTVYAWGACSQLVEDYAELAGGIDYAKTLGTVRTVKSQGPVFNAPPVLPGDSFTAVAGGKVAVAGAVVTITDARCTATCMVDFEPTNAAAVALGNASRAPAAGSFALTFAGAPAGTETFNYRLTEIWKL